MFKVNYTQLLAKKSSVTYSPSFGETAKQENIFLVAKNIWIGKNNLFFFFDIGRQFQSSKFERAGDP